VADLRRQYIDEWADCDTPGYRFELTRRELACAGLGWLFTLTRAQGAETVARLHVADDGTVTVFTGKIEMGQGARTIVTQAVAEEMHVPPARVRVVMGDTELTPDDGGTWASLTTPQTIPVIRKAAAAAYAGVPVAPKDWKVCGTSLPPVRGHDIVTGAMKYAGDFTRPGMKHGKIVRPPAYRATLRSVSGASVRSGDLAGVVADTPAAAARLAAQVKAEWHAEDLPPERYRDKSVPPKAGEGGRYPSLIVAGDVQSGLKASARVHEAQYTLPNIAHVPLEPRSAVAEWNDGRLTVWSGAQAPFLVRKELATAFRIPETDVRVIVVEPGGAYGGKQRGEVELEAARLARDAGAPVKLSWTREEEFTCSYCRPAAVVEVAAGVDAKGRVHALWHRNYNSGAAGLMPPYPIPHYSCEFHRSESPLRQGSYRSLASVANTFARESMMNELAALNGIDALEYRLRNLSDERLKHALQRAGERFGWGRRKGGLACTIEKDARLALFVEMEGVRVRRAVMAIDPGAILNPDGLRSQCEGGIVQGIGGALFEHLTHDARRITNAKLASYRVPRFSDTPEIDVILIDRRDIAGAGAGEAPITLVAPAIAAALGGTRRSLPLLKGKSGGT
jgi:CO/xanthine dehydrogenase Mo-binding subunit